MDLLFLPPGPFAFIFAGGLQREKQWAAEACSGYFSNPAGTLTRRRKHGSCSGHTLQRVLCLSCPHSVCLIILYLSYPHSVCPILISGLALRRWSKLPCTYVSLSREGQETTQLHRASFKQCDLLSWGLRASLSVSDPSPL